MSRILLVDDDTQSLSATQRILQAAGYEVVVAMDGLDALDQIRAPLNGGKPAHFDLVLSDVRMPKLGGLEFLRALNLCGETMPVILMTAFGRVEDAVWAMKLGAVDFLTKPFKRQTLLDTVHSVLARAKPIHSNEGENSTVPSCLDRIIGSSRGIREIKNLIERVAPTSASILISGESGTGKELVAKAIHELSPRKNKAFVALNCAAVPEQLIESELFGFEKGAFTGAVTAKEGLFEAANGGTLLLDEIGDMPQVLQSKLLRVLQEGEVRRVGSTETQKVDVRVIAASHRNLKLESNFRQDLFYRLEVISIVLPPLREREEDVIELAQNFLQSASVRHNKRVEELDAAAKSILLRYTWPGNVRELHNVIERAVVLARTARIECSDFPDHLTSLGDQPLAQGGINSIEVPVGAPLKDVEELLIRKTLEITSGDKNLTARMLGINSRTIYRKLDKQKNH